MPLDSAFVTSGLEAPGSHCRAWQGWPLTRESASSLPMGLVTGDPLNQAWLLGSPPAPDTPQPSHGAASG